MTVVQMYVCTNYKLFLRFSWFLKSLDNVISMNSIPGIFKLFIFDVNVSYQLLVLKFIHFQNMSLNIKTFARTGNEESIQGGGKIIELRVKSSYQPTRRGKIIEYRVKSSYQPTRRGKIIESRVKSSYQPTRRGKIIE